MSLVLLLVACISCTEQTPPLGNGGVAGRVLDEQGEPLSGVTMSLVDSKGDPATGIGVGVLTGADGGFRFRSVPAGTFRVAPVDEQGRLVEPQTVVVSDRGVAQALFRVPTSLAKNTER